MIELGNHEHGQLIAKATRSVYSSGVETVVSRSEHGQFMGGVIFSNFTGTSVCIDVAGAQPNWCNRDILWMAFAYPFIQLKVNVLIGRLWSTNEKAIKFDLHVGFRELARIPGAVPNGDLVIIVMYKEWCKWLFLKPKGLVVVDHLKKEARRYG
jgi:hypothetical protein